MFDATGQLPRNIARAFDNFGQIETWLCAQAIILGVLHIVIDFSRAQESFGGDTAPIQTDSAQIGLFHNRGFHTELRRPNGGHIPTGAGADNDDVE